MNELTAVDLSEEHEALRATVEEFARKQVAPVIGELYERGEFPYEIVARMGEIGLFGLPFPEEHAGMGGDYLALGLALEELARVDSSVAITLEGGRLARRDAGPPVRHRRAEGPLAAPAVRGREARPVRADRARRRQRRGRDPDHRPPRRRRVGDRRLHVLHHEFRHRHHVDRHRHRDHRHRGGRPPGDLRDRRAGRHPPGFTVSAKYSKVGWCASDTRELYFDGCRVPAENLLGERGRGYAQFLSILDEGRVAIAALATGLAQGCVDESVRYARERQAFGAPIGSYQAVQFAIADMAVRAHTARLAWRHAAHLLVAGRTFKREAAIAKLVASNAAMDNARAATQVFGGYGFMNETPVGRFYRDAKILEIGEGTSEVQRMLIARRLGL